MLGRLKMTTKDCIAAYCDLASRVFSSHNKDCIDRYYKPDALEDAVKELVRKYLPDENAPMMGSKDDRCKA